MISRHHWFFDLDGTLARTGEDIILAWKGALTELGRDLTRFDEVFRIGPTLEKMVYELYDDATSELVATLVEKFKPRYDASGFPNTVPYAGVDEMLASLKSSGAKIYIVTNKRDAATKLIAAKFGWNRLFDGIWSFDSFGAKLKKGELLAKVMRENRISPDDAVMVGDTAGDITAGCENNTMTIGVTYGYGTRDELAGADAIVDSPTAVYSGRGR